MGVRIPPPLPLFGGLGSDGVSEARTGVRSGGRGGIPQGHVSEPPGAHQLHGRGDHRDRGGGAVPRRRGHRAGANRGKDFAMSGDAAATTNNKQWFVVHTYSGFENKVKEAIESRAKIFGMSEKITRVLVPTEKVVEVRNKQKRETEQKFFPGYVLVEMELTDDTWHLVRSTPKVTGFVGSGSKPVALPHDQVDDILRQMEAGAEKPKPKSVFARGDKVRVIDGPFVNFQAVVKLQIPAGKANPSPPVGPALGQHGVNIMEFCKGFNAQTGREDGLILPVVVTIYQDRSFTFIVKTPPAAVLLKRAAGIAKASAVPHKDKIGKVTRQQVREIAQTKLVDLNTQSVDSAMRIIEGTARSMGIDVV